MDIEATFPMRIWFNLGRRDDRRARMEAELAKHGLEAERFAAVDGRWAKRARGFESAGRYALALSQRMAVRKARQAGAPAVLLMEDDVEFHPRLREVLEGIELPEDWGIFYLGCAHLEKPAAVGEGLARVRYALDTHAFAVRRRHYRRVIEALEGVPWQDLGCVEASDRLIAGLAGDVPSYAVFPNLAWQRCEYSDLLGRRAGNYDEYGVQLHSAHATRGLAAEVLGGGKTGCPAAEPKSPGASGGGAPAKVAFLFLVRRDIHHPAVWEEYFAGGGGCAGVFVHSKEPDCASSALVRGNLIEGRVPTEWGDVSLVRASLELIKCGLEQSGATHFALVSESCVPVKPLEALARSLSMDPRSRMRTETLEEVMERHPAKAARYGRLRRVPANCVHFTSQWMILGRRDAELVVSKDFTGEFEEMFAPDECYFPTVLAMSGVEPKKEFRQCPPTWIRWGKGCGHPESFGEADGELAAELFESPAWFARKFEAGSDIGRFGLHLPGGVRGGIFRR